MNEEQKKALSKLTADRIITVIRQVKKAMTSKEQEDLKRRLLIIEQKYVSARLLRVLKEW